MHWFLRVFASLFSTVAQAASVAKGITKLGTMTVIEIRPHQWGWKAFESPGVEPVFPKKDQAIDYAQNRIWLF